MMIEVESCFGFINNPSGLSILVPTFFACDMKNPYLICSVPKVFFLKIC